MTTPTFLTDFEQIAASLRVFQFQLSTRLHLGHKWKTVCLQFIKQLRLMSLPFGYLVIFRWSFSEQKTIYSLDADPNCAKASWWGHYSWWVAPQEVQAIFLFKCELCKDIFESEETMRCHIMKRRNDLFWPVMEPLFSESGTGGSDQSSHQGLSLWLAYKPTKY